MQALGAEALMVKDKWKPTFLGSSGSMPRSVHTHRNEVVYSGYTKRGKPFEFPDQLTSLNQCMDREFKLGKHTRVRIGSTRKRLFSVESIFRQAGKGYISPLIAEWPCRQTCRCCTCCIRSGLSTTWQAQIKRECKSSLRISTFLATMCHVSRWPEEALPFQNILQALLPSSLSLSNISLTPFPPCNYTMSLVSDSSLTYLQTRFLLRFIDTQDLKPEGEPLR